MNFVFKGSFEQLALIASFAISNDTPSHSNNTLPGLITATQ